MGRIRFKLELKSYVRVRQGWEPNRQGGQSADSSSAPLENVRKFPPLSVILVFNAATGEAAVPSFCPHLS
eukprot:3924174-Pleurochrysis_carterae.AAC.1